MISPFAIGLVGSLVLVTGSALPTRAVKKAYKAPQNWLFAIGGLLMLTYSSLNYLNGGPIFFVFLQALVNIASILMMFDVPDNIDTPIVSGVGILLIAWSLTLFEGYNTLIFIIGLIGIGLGYTMNTGTFKRSTALAIGSALIATYSYLEVDWIFFWLNVF
ncbi:MAG: hypothetical protein Q8P95_03870, partial [bacterium]|nr:hypothetical protein [bacterium]